MVIFVQITIGLICFAGIPFQGNQKLQETPNWFLPKVPPEVAIAHFELLIQEATSAANCNYKRKKTRILDIRNEEDQVIADIEFTITCKKFLGYPIQNSLLRIPGSGKGVTLKVSLVFEWTRDNWRLVSLIQNLQQSKDSKLHKDKESEVIQEQNKTDKKHED